VTTEVLEGLLEVRVVDVGAKAAMPATVLTTDRERLILRTRGASRLDVGPDLLAYDGRRVRVTGTRSFRTFVVDSVEPID